MDDQFDLAKKKRISCTKKKELTDALADIQKTQTTNHPLIIDISRARKINRVIGFPAITPWQVSELDETWINIFEELFVDEDKKTVIQKAKNLFNNVLAQRRAAHPTYGRY